MVKDTIELAVYVRLCADVAEGEDQPPCRELNFRIPEGFPQGELLERDWAIDGNNARKAVRPERGVPLTDVLRAQQVTLVQWLGEMGYRVVFR